MLLINDFEKKYAETLILTIDNYSFDQGIYWIRGENGSGKSTLFKALAGIIPCRGEIGFDDGITLHDDPVQYRYRVNFSEAEPLYPGFLSAKDIFHFVATAKGGSKAQREHLITYFGIDQFFSKPCSTYSSGMLKRLSLALSFVGSPGIIILDEPLITLDGMIRKALIDLIITSMEHEKIIFLISSHEFLTDADLPITKTLSIVNKKLLQH